MPEKTQVIEYGSEYVQSGETSLLAAILNQMKKNCFR